MAFSFPRMVLVPLVLIVAGVLAVWTIVLGEQGHGASAAMEAANVQARWTGPEGLDGVVDGSAAEGVGLNSSLSSTTEDNGRILVDNYGNTTGFTTSAKFDDAQGFTTGNTRYLLTGVQLASNSVAENAQVAVVISEPTADGYPGTTLFELESPSELLGRPFFSAPENAILKPNTAYLVRIDVTVGWVGWEFTTDKSETGLGLSSWSIDDHFLTSSGPMEGIDWIKDDTKTYALTIWGNEAPDDYGQNYWTAGRLKFSRHSGESPEVDAVINYSSDRDWFNTKLSFDYGGRYRIDVKPVTLADNDDIGVRAFHADYPGDHSRDPALELTAVSDPPAGYVSWHFEAARNYGPFIDVYADNGTTGAYSIRVVYDPDRIWTRTEVVRGDLPHDDTTWAAIEVDSEEADQGVYHYYADYDWYAVELEEDTSYVFRAIAAGAYSEYMNPSIKLYDSDGNELASDYISHGDSSTTFVSIAHQVGSGEDGTYYIAVSNAQLWDDPDEMALLGVTEPRVLFSPFWGARYYVLASSVGGNNERRNVRTVSGNEDPRILNVRAISLPEGSTLQEHIAAYDFDAQDAITGYEVSGGVDADLFPINSSGVLTMSVETGLRGAGGFGHGQHLRVAIEGNQRRE